MQPTLDEIISRYKSGSREALLPLLQDIQLEYGYLNEEAILKVGRHIKLPSGKVYGIATFYDQFRFVPKGKFHIKVCKGTSCHMHGTSGILREVERVLNVKEGNTTRDGRFSRRRRTGHRNLTGRGRGAGGGTRAGAPSGVRGGGGSRSDRARSWLRHHGALGATREEQRPAQDRHREQHVKARRKPHQTPPLTRTHTILANLRNIPSSMPRSSRRMARVARRHITVGL